MQTLTAAPAAPDPDANLIFAGGDFGPDSVRGEAIERAVMRLIGPCDSEERFGALAFAARFLHELGLVAPGQLEAFDARCSDWQEAAELAWREAPRMVRAH